MSINKKELIAQISQNVKAPGGETLPVGVRRSDVLPANEEKKVQVQEKARKISPSREPRTSAANWGFLWISKGSRSFGSEV